MSAGETLITLTADIVAAHVSNNSVAVNDLAALIANVHGALSAVGEPAIADEVKQEPAVSARASVKPDYLVRLEDGKKLNQRRRAPQIPPKWQAGSRWPPPCLQREQESIARNGPAPRIFVTIRSVDRPDERRQLPCPDPRHMAHPWFGA